MHIFNPRSSLQFIEGAAEPLNSIRCNLDLCVWESAGLNL